MTVQTAPDRRIVGLDGLRGALTLAVIISHYFGELAHGVRGLTFGWYAVAGFFVLSGVLIGRLILEKKDTAGFFTVFYVRRACRILPPFLIVVLGLSALLAFIRAPWRDADVQFPLWTYLTFTQNFYMAARGSIGAHWLAPTWTLAVEEHFYLVAPALIVFTPRRWLAPILVGICMGAVALRLAIFGFGVIGPAAGHALTPAIADMLAVGVLTGLGWEAGIFSTGRWDRLLPWAPVAGFVLALGLFFVSRPIWETFRPLLIGLAMASYLVCIMRGLPMGERMNARTLQFFGNNGYCLYLTHLPVLGLMHGVILGARPDLATPAQWAVTFASLPVCVLVGWSLTRFVEEPFMALGRRWKWGSSRPTQAPRQAVA